MDKIVFYDDQGIEHQKDITEATGDELYQYISTLSMNEQVDLLQELLLIVKKYNKLQIMLKGGKK